MTELRFELPDAVLETIIEAVTQRVLARLERGPEETSEYLNIDEACALLRCKRQRIYDLRSAGRLTKFGDGSGVLVSRAELMTHLAGEAVSAYDGRDTSTGGHRANGPAPAPGGKS